MSSSLVFSLIFVPRLPFLCPLPSRSHASSRGNKRRILEFLIPVKLRLGRFPKRRLLEKYGLLQFATLAGAIQTGDLRVFNEAVREHQEFFVRKGIFLIIDQCKIYVYRNLFRKVHNVHKSLEADAKKANQVPLASFQTALALSGLAGDDAMDIDELECVLANLIFQNFIKGYIAHKQGKLVLSPLTAFPKLVEAASARK